MDDREFEKILASAEQLRLREKEPEPWAEGAASGKAGAYDRTAVGSE